jgi:tetratricopeptide (TPR) repeat protein
MELMDLHRHFGRLKEALELGEAIIDSLTATAGVDPHDLAKAHVRRATITWVSGQYQLSADGLQRAAELFRQVGDPLQAAFAEGNLGLVYYSMSRYRSAEALMLTAIRAAEEGNARYRLVSDLGDLSVVYIALGRMDLAYDYTSRMVELATDLGNTAELSRARGNRGYALLGLGRYEEALADIEFSLDLYRRQGRQEGTLVTTIDMIMYLRGIGEEERAARLAQETYEAAWQGDFPHLHIVTTRCLALFPPAERQQALLRRALVLAREHERPMDEAGCLFSLAAIEPDRKTRAELYRQGSNLLAEMGCTGWLRAKSPADPPLLPMVI